MGQYYDFGAQIGAVLSEVMNRAERSRQFDAQQAADYMRLQEAAKQWKQEFQARRDESKRNYNFQVGTENADVINQLRDDYVTADAIRALGLNPKTFTGVSGKSVNEQYSKAYGRQTSLVDDNATLYDVKTVSAAKAALEQARAVDKMTPRVISGIENIPVPKTQNTMSVDNTAVIPIDLPKFSSPVYQRVSQSVQRDPAQKAAVKNEILQELKLRIPSLDTNNIVDVAYDGAKKQAVIKYSQSAVGEDGLPAPLEQRSTYSKEEVANFFKVTYPKILADYSRMTPLDKQRDQEMLIGVGGALQDIVSQYPEYQQSIQPFSMYSQAANALRQEKMAKTAAQLQMQKRAQDLSRLDEITVEKGFSEEEVAEAKRIRLQMLGITQ